MKTYYHYTKKGHEDNYTLGYVYKDIDIGEYLFSARRDEDLDSLAGHPILKIIARSGLICETVESYNRNAFNAAIEEL